MKVSPTLNSLLASGRRGFWGLLLGYSLLRMGFADFAEVHRMFVLADLRLILTFGGAVAGTALGLRLLGRSYPRGAVTPETVWGSALFGLGWALCGACPGAILAQLGSGQAWALLTLIGALGGMFLAARLADRKSGDAFRPVLLLLFRREG